MATDPKKYSLYSQRSAEEQYVNWGQVASDVTKGIVTIAAERQGRRDAIDKQTTEAIEKLSEVADVSNGSARALLITGSNMSKENLMIQTDLLKRGLITEKDYQLFLNQQQTGYSSLSTAVKQWDKYYIEAQGRLEVGPDGINSQASDGEIYNNESMLAFGNLNNKILWTNPTNGQMQLVQMSKDSRGNYTAMPDAKTQPGKFLNPNYMNVRMNFKENRKVLGSQADKIVESIAPFIEDTLMEYGTISSLTDFRKLADFGYKEDGTKQTYEGWLGDEAGALVAVDSDVVQILTAKGYNIAQDVDEYKEKHCKGKSNCDTNKWIKVSYKDGVPVYDINGDKKDEAERFAKSAIEIRIGRTLRLSGTRDKETQLEHNKTQLQKDQFGYLTRVQDIVRGDLSEYSSASARGIQGMNRDADGNMKTNPAEKIDSIKRVGDQIIITYQNGKEEPVDRKDDNGNIRSTKDVMGELFQLLTPYGDSYDDIVDLYTTGDKAKTIKVSARDMDDAEITTMLKNNAARVEVMKGKKEGEEPTPKEIADAAKGITITDAQITDAKKNGIPQTYVGADAIAYSSRDPYKIKSSGDAIIRGQGDTIPSITGEDALREDIRPTTPGETPKTTLPGYFWTTDAKQDRKIQIDGALNKVFKAYLPSSVVRSKSKIEFNPKTAMLTVTYKNKKVSIPGVTDVVIDKNTTFTNLDKTIAEAAKYITRERNKDFAGRKSGKPPAY